MVVIHQFHLIFSRMALQVPRGRVHLPTRQYKRQVHSLLVSRSLEQEELGLDQIHLRILSRCSHLTVEIITLHTVCNFTLLLLINISTLTGTMNYISCEITFGTEKLFSWPSLFITSISDSHNKLYRVIYDGFF